MASDGDVARLIDPLLQLPLALALGSVCWVAAWLRRRGAASGPGVRPPARRVDSESVSVTRRAALAIGLVAMALPLPWTGPEPMDHLEYALVVETDLAQSGWEVLVNRVGIEQAHQPLSRVPIALARHVGLPPASTRWLQLAAWFAALAGAWRWMRALAGSWTGARAEHAADAVALAAFAWVAWSPLGARYGFDATPYGLFAALSWWCAVALHEVARGHSRWRWPGVVLAAAAFYTHYVALWFFAGNAAMAWLESGRLEAPARRAARLDLVMVVAGFGLTVVPWLPAMRWGAVLFRGYVSREVALYAMDFPWWAQARETFRIATGWPGWTSAVALALAGGALALGGDHARRAGGAALLGLAPFVAFRAVQQYQYAEASGGTYFGARHALPFVPLVALPIVAAMESMLARWLPARVSPTGRAAALGVLPLVAFASTVAGRAEVCRPDIRGAARYVREHLEDGDAVGVLPRFFYSALVVDEVSAGKVRFQDASGFARLPLGRGDGRPGPLVWVPADDREFPFPAALENRAFRRVWVIDFQEREFGLLELAPLVSHEVTAHMDTTHRLIERRIFDQLVLSLYVLDDEREEWDLSPWVIDEASWREHARDVSWTVDGGRVTYRIDLPSPRSTTLAELTLAFPAAGDSPAASRVRVTVGHEDETFEIPSSGGRHTVQLSATGGESLVARLAYPSAIARAPSRIELRAVRAVF